MARLLITALGQAGHAVEIVSSLRSFLPSRTPRGSSAMERGRPRECGRHRARLERGSGCSRIVWFTYHNHYKAPDLLGRRTRARFGLPFVMAEASHAPSRSAQWGGWHAAAENATRAADAHLVLHRRATARALPALLHPGACAIDLAPFVDVRSWPRPQPGTRSGPVRLVTVAMMRHGDKLESYRFLAASLGLLARPRLAAHNRGRRTRAARR